MPAVSFGCLALVVLATGGTAAQTGSSAGLPTIALATSAGDRVQLRDENGKVQRELGHGAQAIAFSQSGRYLASIQPDGSVTSVDLGEKDSPEVVVANQATGIKWLAGDRLAVQTKTHRILAWTASGLIQTLAAGGNGLSEDPTGGNLAFTVDGKAGGIWLTAKDGSGLHRILAGKVGGGTDWAYDGRLVAGVVDGHLWLVRPNGLAKDDLGVVDEPRVKWSTGSPFLLAHRNGGWAVWSALTREWTALAFDAATIPVWIGPNRLEGTQAGNLLDQSMGSPPDGAPIAQGVTAFERAPRVFFGAAFPSPFKNAPVPRRSQTALVGRIASWDPTQETLRLDVTMQREADGTERILSNPTPVSVNLPSRLALGRILLPETDIWVVVEADRVRSLRLPDETGTDSEDDYRFRRTLGRAASGGGGRPARIVEYDGVCMDKVVVPMIHPLPGRRHDPNSFLEARDGGSRRHHGNDLMAPKMTPELAVFDGTVYFSRQKGIVDSNSLSLVGDDGWEAEYLHINNDNPGTDDDAGSFRYAYPADLMPGQRVKAGQIIAYCGNSGNAKYVGPHLHFELHDLWGGGILNPYYSLRASRHLDGPLYEDPDPSLRPLAGETRQEGVVVDSDPVRNTLVVELCWEGTSRSAMKRARIPHYVYLKWHSTPAVRSRDAVGVTYPLEAIKAGLLVSAVGRGMGSRLDVREASVGLPGVDGAGRK